PERDVYPVFDGRLKSRPVLLPNRGDPCEIPVWRTDLLKKRQNGWLTDYDRWDQPDALFLHFEKDFWGQKITVFDPVQPKVNCLIRGNWGPGVRCDLHVMTMSRVNHGLHFVSRHSRSSNITVGVGDATGDSDLDPVCAGEDFASRCFAELRRTIVTLA